MTGRQREAVKVLLWAVLAVLGLFAAGQIVRVVLWAARWNGIP